MILRLHAPKELRVIRMKSETALARSETLAAIMGNWLTCYCRPNFRGFCLACGSDIEI